MRVTLPAGAEEIKLADMRPGAFFPQLRDFGYPIDLLLHNILTNTETSSSTHSSAEELHG